jgi:hypothetical protein
MELAAALRRGLEAATRGPSSQRQHQPAAIRRHAAELAAIAPDVIGSSTVGPLMQVARTVPIVFPTGAPPREASASLGSLGSSRSFRQGWRLGSDEVYPD